MTRRRALQLVGVGGLVVTTGCAALGDGSAGSTEETTGGVTSKRPMLTVVAVEDELTGGGVTVSVEVANQGTARGTTTLYVEADVDAGGSYNTSTQITVDAGEQESFQVSIDIDESRMMGAEGVETTAWIASTPTTTADR